MLLAAKARLSHIKGGQLPLHPRMGLTISAGPLVKVGYHVRAHRGDRFRCQLEGLHLLQEFVLNKRIGQMGHVARSVLLTCTQKTLVHKTVGIGDTRVNELVVTGTPSRFGVAI